MGKSLLQAASTISDIIYILFFAESVRLISLILISFLFIF